MTIDEIYRKYSHLNHSFSGMGAYGGFLGEIVADLWTAIKAARTDAQPDARCPRCGGPLDDEGFCYCKMDPNTYPEIPEYHTPPEATS